MSASVFLQPRRAMDRPLIVVSYALAPGPGGPEAVVTGRLIEALRHHWRAPVVVISAAPGTAAVGGERFRHHALGEAGEAGRGSLSVQSVAAGATRMRRQGGIAALPGRIADRVAVRASGMGVHRWAWQKRAAAVLEGELDRLPGAIVLSRVLPVVSLGAVARVRRRRTFPWIVTFNDPTPVDVWPGQFASHPRSIAAARRLIRLAAPLLSGLGFPARRLAEIERAAFPELAHLPSTLLPHPIADRPPRLPRLTRPDAHLKLVFIGALRRDRQLDVLPRALEGVASSHPALIEDLRLHIGLTVDSPAARRYVERLGASCLLHHVPPATPMGIGPDALGLSIEGPVDAPLLMTKNCLFLEQGRPWLALCAPGGTSWDMTRHRGGGFAADFADSRSVAETLVEVHRTWRRSGRRLPDVEKALRERFTYRRIVDDLRALIDAALAGRRGHLGADWP